MSTKKILAHSIFLLLVISFLLGIPNNASATDTYHYAATDMTWAEFYAGELGQTSADLLDAGLDAVSSATTGHSRRDFPQLVSADVPNGGTKLIGPKAVQVRMTEEVYNLLSNDSRYTFSDDTFTEYKEVSSDGSFGAMVTTSRDISANVTISTGTSATWGDYQLQVSGDIIPYIASADNRANYLGAILETASGDKYGLRFNNNIWYSTARDIAFVVAPGFMESHGVVRDSTYTADLPGQTIKKITYIIKNSDDLVVSCDVTIPHQVLARTVEPEGGYVVTGTQFPVEIAFTATDGSEISGDYTSATVTAGGGRGRAGVTLNQSTFASNILTISHDVLSADTTYTATFSSSTNNAARLRVKLFTDFVNDKVMPEDDSAVINFLLTAYGASSSVDKTLDTYKFANASVYADRSNSSSGLYNSGAWEIKNSGFSFDVALSGVPEDYTGLVGFSFAASVSSDDMPAGTFDKIKALTVYNTSEGDYRLISDFESLGLQVVHLMPDGTSRDISKLVSCGAILDEDTETVTFVYGGMATDSDLGTFTEGAYFISSEGNQYLINDGASDNHVKVTMYIASLTAPEKKSPDVPPYVPPVSPDQGGSATVKESKFQTPSAALQEAVKNSAVVQNVAGKISSALTAKGKTLPAGVSGELKILPDSAKLAAQVISSSDIKSRLTASEDQALILEPLRVTEAGIYYMALSSADLIAGRKLIMHLFVSSDVTASASVAASSITDEGENAVFINSSGEVIDTVPANKDVNVATYLEANKTYTPVVAMATGSSDDSSSDSNGPGSSGGGCNSLSVTALVVLAVAAFKRKQLH